MAVCVPTPATASSLFVNVVADPVPCSQLREILEGDVVSLVGPVAQGLDGRQTVAIPRWTSWPG